MGGRGAGSGGRAAGGISMGSIIGTKELLSTRDEGRQREADQVLNVLRDVRDQYGVTATEAQVASLRGRASSSCIAYYDASGNVAVNKKFYDEQKINQSYDHCVASGFHPSRGNKTGLEAVVAHEMGHRLTEVAGLKAGYGTWQLDRVGDEIVNQAMKNLKRTDRGKFRKKISGYADHNNAETLAEAFADVYCNGKKAKRESREVVNILNEYLRR